MEHFSSYCGCQVGGDGRSSSDIPPLSWVMVSSFSVWYSSVDPTSVCSCCF